MLNALRDQGFDVLTRNHADAILAHDFPDELGALVTELTSFRITAEELIGGESGQTQWLRHALDGIGWSKHSFSVQVMVDGQARGGVSYEVDHVLRVSAGNEWNNKDPFFDRDLENFQRLHALSAISLGVIVTRGRSMQDQMLGWINGYLSARNIGGEADLERLGLGPRTEAQKRAVASQTNRGVPFAEAFARKFVSDKFGPATTHWAKLEDRVARGVGNPCPLLLIGLPASILTNAPAMPEEPDLFRSYP